MPQSNYLKLPSIVRFEFFPFPALDVAVLLSRSTLIFTFSPCNWNCLSNCSMKAKSSAGRPRNCSTMLFAGVLVGLAEDAFLWCPLSTDLALAMCRDTFMAITCANKFKLRQH